jgi:hypothetical protein
MCGAAATYHASSNTTRESSWGNPQTAEGKGRWRGAHDQAEAFNRTENPESKPSIEESGDRDWDKTEAGSSSASGGVGSATSESAARFHDM